jgi:CTP synthase
MINERHRHRWEFNNSYLERFEAAGLVASGKNPESNLVEIIELPSHPFFIGVQYHPELKSTVESPQPVFVNFIKAAKNYSELKNAIKNPALQGEMM